MRKIQKFSIAALMVVAGPVPASAAVASGTLTVGAVVVDSCTVARDAAGGGDVVRCSGTAPAFRILSDTAGVIGPEDRVRTTVFF